MPGRDFGMEVAEVVVAAEPDEQPARSATVSAHAVRRRERDDVLVDTSRRPFALIKTVIGISFRACYQAPWTWYQLLPNRKSAWSVKYVFPRINALMLTVPLYERFAIQLSGMEPGSHVTPPLAAVKPALAGTPALTFTPLTHQLIEGLISVAL